MADEKKEFKVEVIADRSGKWSSNGLRFETVEIAERYARDLWSRWTAVSAWRVARVDSGEVLLESGK